MTGDPAVGVRIAILGILAFYIGVIVSSRALALSPDFEIPLVMLGWIVLIGLIALNFRRRSRWRLDVRWVLRPLVLTLIFAALVATATYLALGGVPSECHGSAFGCMKGYQWRVEDGNYFRIGFENEQTQITQVVYVQEVGNRLRSASIFGLYCLCPAWILAAGARRAEGSNQP